jgi:spectinomycin phosphotransferase
VLTQPADIAEETLRSAVRHGWGFDAVTLRYLPVGFGSHHWLAADAAGNRLFLTVDDLAAKLLTATDKTDAAFGRLHRAFSAAASLRRDCGLDFVVAPVPARDGQLLLRLQDRYSMVVHPYLDGAQPGAAAAVRQRADLEVVIGALVALHHARPEVLPQVDDLAVPLRGELTASMHHTGQPWDAGPYSEYARDLLAKQAADLARLLATFDSLASKVAARPDRMVVTHGEPGAHNVVKTPAGLVLVDWDSILLAAPERDLWAMAEHDPSVLDAYSAASGVIIDDNALACHRMFYDLFEIAGYIRLFRLPHGDTADAAESWQNLQHFLQPAARWPGVFRGSRPGR